MATTYDGLSRTDAELKQIFQRGESKRGDYELRWEDQAGWTLPSLFTRYENSTSQEWQHDYQSLGAQAVNHLANKISMTLFAPARPFFRIELSPEDQRALLDGNMSHEDIETLTGRVEKEAMRNMEKVQLRTAVIMAIKNLIVLGNTLMYFPEDDNETAQVYHLKDYIVDRDCGGKVIRIVTRDHRIVGTLPADLREQAAAQGLDTNEKIELFTGATLQEDGKFFVKQELGDQIVVTDGQGIVPKEKLPWLPLTWNLVRGEEYGIGLVEEYGGDFHVYSQMSESLLNLAALASDIKILVNPIGQTNVDDLNESESGTYVHGVIDDVGFLQMEKMADLSSYQGMMDIYGRRIGSAFLLNTQVTRDAERVTAEEIRLQANELESSLGGVYSRLAEEMQQPLARMLLRKVDSALADLNPRILTGVESLSRNSEHEQMMLFLNDLTFFQNIPEQLQAEMKLGDLARIMATNRSIEHEKFMKTDKEMKAEREAMEQRAAKAQFDQSAAQAAGESAGQPSPPVM